MRICIQTAIYVVLSSIALIIQNSACSFGYNELLHVHAMQWAKKKVSGVYITFAAIYVVMELRELLPCAQDSYSQLVEICFQACKEINRR